MHPGTPLSQQYAHIVMQKWGCNFSKTLRHINVHINAAAHSEHSSITRLTFSNSRKSSLPPHFHTILVIEYHTRTHTHIHRIWYTHFYGSKSGFCFLSISFIPHRFAVLSVVNQQRGTSIHKHRYTTHTYSKPRFRSLSDTHTYITNHKCA